jgi:hypothetical protein
VVPVDPQTGLPPDCEAAERLTTLIASGVPEDRMTRRRRPVDRWGSIGLPGSVSASAEIAPMVVHDHHRGRVGR